MFPRKLQIGVGLVSLLFAFAFVTEYRLSGLYLPTTGDTKLSDELFALQTTVDMLVADKAAADKAAADKAAADKAAADKAAADKAKQSVNCPHGLIYTWGLDNPYFQENCFVNETTKTLTTFGGCSKWDPTCSESQHSMNTYLWYSMRWYECTTYERTMARWFFAIADFHSKECKHKLTGSS